MVVIGAPTNKLFSRAVTRLWLGQMDVQLSRPPLIVRENGWSGCRCGPALFVHHNLFMLQRDALVKRANKSRRVKVSRLWFDFCKSHTSWMMNANPSLIALSRPASAHTVNRFTSVRIDFAKLPDYRHYTLQTHTKIRSHCLFHCNNKSGTHSRETRSPEAAASAHLYACKLYNFLSKIIFSFMFNNSLWYVWYWKQKLKTSLFRYLQKKKKKKKKRIFSKMCTCDWAKSN